MNVADLLNPEKMKSIDERFRAPTAEDYAYVDRKMAELGLKRQVPYISKKPTSSSTSKIHRYF